MLLAVNHITLSFTDFDIENNRQNCTTDFVEILDGNNYEAPLQGIVPFPHVFHTYRIIPKVSRRRFSVHSLLLHGFSLITESPWPLWPEKIENREYVFSVNGRDLLSSDYAPTNLQLGVDSSCLFCPLQLNSIENQAIPFKPNFQLTAQKHNSQAQQINAVHAKHR